DPVFGSRQIVPERRMRPLALPQHLLVDERQLRQPLQSRRRLCPGPHPPMQRRARDDILALALPSRLPARGEVVRVGKVRTVDQHGLTLSLVSSGPCYLFWLRSCVKSAEGL